MGATVLETLVQVSFGHGNNCMVFLHLGHDVSNMHNHKNFTPGQALFTVIEIWNEVVFGHSSGSMCLLRGGSQ